MMFKNVLHLALGIMIFGLALTSINCTSDAKPPVAKIVPHVDTILTHERIDNYSWLRKKDDPEVIDYLKAENAYTEAIMKHTEKLQEKLYSELVGRIKETDLSVPYKKGDFYYYSRTEEGKQYKIYCRKKGSLDAEEEILLDVNKLAEGKDYMYLGAYKISPDHKLLAFAADEIGNERYTLRVKNLETGELLPDVIDSVDTSIEWANDNKTLFYCVHDDAWRPFKLYRHVLDSDPKEDFLVHHEADNAFWLDISKTKSEKYLLMVMGNKTTREVHFLNADNPYDRFRIIHPRQRDMKYHVRHHGNRFYIMSNENAKNYKLMVTSISKPSKTNWKEIIPHSPAVKIDDIELFREFLVIYEREGGLQKIRLLNLDNNSEREIDFPEPAYSIEQSNNPEYNSHILRFVYESMITPASVYDYDMKTGERELKKQKEVLGGFNPDDYITERIFAPVNDSVMVPVSLVYKKGMVKDGSNPLYLYGYGSYGANYDPYFSSIRLSLLNRGFIFAIAHVRGSGIMGRYWYDDGRLLKKKNTFTDFIACAEYLIDEKYTSKEKLAAVGGSAGGLLVGAVSNMRPDLFRIIIADVPFVDVINTMLDESIPLTVLEYDEWGNPNEEKYYDYMMSYSPYDNVKAQAYPNILITTSLNDTRVQYWEPAKWTAKLRSMKTDCNRLLLKTTMGAGHGGVSGRYARLKEIAFEYAFILDILGIKE